MRSLNILAFDDPLPPGADPHLLLGGKGAGLAEMTTELLLPVPPGFTITTEVCRRYLSTGWPDELDAQIQAQLERLAERTGRRFGDPAAPLLVSVRSGAPVSMPGMMDTVLNVGMTPGARERLARESGDPAFAADTWLRFSRMYAEIVLALPGGEVASAAVCDGTAAGKLAAAERIHRLAANRVPLEPREQLRCAIEAVFRSWNSERAQVFRAREGIAGDLGTAVTIQAMVFGNLDDRSGTGVVFTRCPVTGDAAPVGDYIVRAQGEDVVGGTHFVSGLEALRRQLPDTHAELCDVLHRMEHHYRDLCDVEFTVSAGRLYILQTRIGRRSPQATARVAIAMAEDDDFPLTKAEAIARVGSEVLAKLGSAASIDPAAEFFARGLAASPGVGTGILSCDPDEAADLSAKGVAVVLAREATSPADVHGMVGAAALVTTTGGILSHAAVVARSWAIPAVTSLADAEVSEAGLRIAGRLIAPGALLTIDGGSGIVYLGDCRASGAGEVDEAQTLRRWAAELGVEPGETAGDTTASTAAREVTLLEVMRTVQLKGLCTAERAAAVVGADVDSVTALIEANEGLFKATPRGSMPSPMGQDWLTEALAGERSAVDVAALDGCYERFVLLDGEFKRLVTGWQMLAGGGQTDEAQAEMVASVSELNEKLQPIIGKSARQAARLRRYAPRLDAAVAQLRAGDASMLASPLKDSYHTVWFEFHEELISLCGRDRAAEERAAR